MITRYHLSNQCNKFQIKNNLTTLNSTNSHSIQMNIKLFNGDSYSILRILHLKRKAIKDHLIGATLTNNLLEIDYWTTIKNSVNSLLHKLKETEGIHELLDTLNFSEMDCLVGIVEEYLHECYIDEMQLVKDDTPLITKSLQHAYSIIIPIYEQSRTEFESKQDNGA